jgi:hypothetical protein
MVRTIFPTTLKRALLLGTALAIWLHSVLAEACLLVSLAP